MDVDRFYRGVIIGLLAYAIAYAVFLSVLSACGA